jgi:uncharacterized membrane protein
MHSSSFRLVVIAAAYLVSAIVMPRLPSAPPGSPMLARGGPLVLAFLLPTTAIAVCLLFSGLASKDPFRGNYRRFQQTYELTLNAAVAFIIVLHAILLLTLLGGVSWMGRAPALLVGTLLVLVGNVVPRLRPNLVLGIRTTRILQDERAWARTHRLSGYALVALGVIVLAATVFARQWLGWVVGAGIPILAAALTGASYLIRRD